MASSLEIFKAQKGMEAGKGVGDAYKQRLFSKLQSQAIGNQMDALGVQIESNKAQIRGKAKQVQAAQTQAFIAGGVEIEGTAMDVLAETAADAAEASYTMQREANFKLEALAGERAAAKEAGSDLNFILNSAASVTNAYASYGADKGRYTPKKGLGD